MKIIKRGQVSVFIILAIIIVAVIIVYFIIMNIIDEKDTGNENIAPEIQPIYDYMSECIFQIGEDAIEYVSLRGGYYEIPDLSSDLEIPYFIYNGNIVMPSKEKINEQISLYLEKNVSYCARNLYKYPDYKVSFDKVNVKTIIENEKVRFNVNFPLTLSKDNKNYVIENFEESVDVRLGLVYDTITKINEEDSICLNCIHTLAFDNDVYIDMIEYDDDFIFVIRDEHSKINDKFFLFVFANKYNNKENEL